MILQNMRHGNFYVFLLDKNIRVVFIMFYKYLFSYYRCVDINYVSILDYIKLIFLLKIFLQIKKMKNNIQLLFTTKFLNDQKCFDFEVKKIFYNKILSKILWYSFKKCFALLSFLASLVQEMRCCYVGIGHKIC
jgi:hypothetical protein